MLLRFHARDPEGGNVVYGDEEDRKSWKVKLSD